MCLSKKFFQVICKSFKWLAICRVGSLSDIWNAVNVCQATSVALNRGYPNTNEDSLFPFIGFSEDEGSHDDEDQDTVNNLSDSKFCSDSLEPRTAEVGYMGII